MQPGIVPADWDAVSWTRMRDVLLSVLIPLYNEEEFIRTVLDRVLAAPLPDIGYQYSREVIVVDDGSSDGSPETVMEYVAAHPGAPMRLIRHGRNRGKGAAIRSAIALCNRRVLDHPGCRSRVRSPRVPKVARAAAGRRCGCGVWVAVRHGRRSGAFCTIGIRLRTGFSRPLCNIASDLNLTDMETCYKVFRTSLLQSIPSA